MNFIICSNSVGTTLKDIKVIKNTEDIEINLQFYKYLLISSLKKLVVLPKLRCSLEIFSHHRLPDTSLSLD